VIWPHCLVCFSKEMKLNWRILLQACTIP
jgi:hypothetical protein